MTNGFCETILNWFVGPTDQTNFVSTLPLLFHLIRIYKLFIDQMIPLQKLLPIFFGHFPNGCSFNQFLHFRQLLNTGHFQKFDYGRIQNLMHYKRPSPPDYNLKNVKVPVAVYYAESDTLTVVQDIKRFINEIPNVVFEYLVPHKLFNHIDFIVATNSQKLIFDDLVKTMKSNPMTNNILE